MSTAGFGFARSNLSKLIALPKYLLSVLFSWFVPRAAERWVFGSGAGVGEGALALAKELRSQDPSAVISWLVADETEAETARSHGFTPVLRAGWRGYWVTLRAGTIVVTHGLGDANRFGVFGGRTVQLWHGAPLKRLHLDSPVTTKVAGPAPVRALLRRMYLAGAREVSLFVAGSQIAAERLRTAFRVDPGLVRVLGDPRDDELALDVADAHRASAARARIITLLGSEGRAIPEHAPVVLYAPTWRDGEVDPAAPSGDEAAAVLEMLERTGIHLVLRSHPLGLGAYESLDSSHVHRLGADLVRDITPDLAAFDAVITDYSSIAIDFALTGRPIVWFAPDLERYTETRGLYEPLEVTSRGRVEREWAGVARRLEELAAGGPELRAARRETRDLAARFHAFPAGGAAARVLAQIRVLQTPAKELVPAGSVFFESYYGRQVGCNPAALDAEIAARFPAAQRFWSVTSERQSVPEGATPVLVGGHEWFAARKRARILIVNDWLRYGFRRGRGQTVLQTWHGTMLKHLALGRPDVKLRTRIAIRRESRRWNLLLSQNPHSTVQFRESYAFGGEILELGYPRDDRLARAVAGDAANPIAVAGARAALGVPAGVRVLAYAPTWRDGAVTIVDDLDVVALADELGDGWCVVVRGHTRTHALGQYPSAEGRVIDASRHPDVNDLILAADLLVTDYSSIMFDAAVTGVPQAFFVPDLVAYRDRERGFTFDFERQAPGPLLTERREVAAHAQELAENSVGGWVAKYAEARAAWRERFAPHEDGGAAARVVDELESRGLFEASA